ncbi:unnamed protein product [Polarella glacialis]|uniref:Uncharacterized protein n=1 Tax=Polarella glacialis TaxID=89957 RepID=A0A813JKG5_POLGL|nr:unnamed protein product [Polarella glacialis]CAE8679094.1 unnamed protein product [Polarella glacialis]
MAIAMVEQLTKPRATRRSLLLPVLVAAAGAIASLCVALPSSLAPTSQEVSHDVAFTGAPSARALLNRRTGSGIAMEGANRRQTAHNLPKKLHTRYRAETIQKLIFRQPDEFQQMFFQKEPTLGMWSQTLKLTFTEGQDDVVTEDEVRAYFTTETYAPEAIIIGHQLPHEEVKHTYVHFNSNVEATAARKEKDGGAIGQASEVKLVYADEKKWIRLRDGATLSGGPRARWMRAYGNKAYPGAGPEWALQTGTRNNPYYPE